MRLLDQTFNQGQHRVVQGVAELIVLVRYEAEQVEVAPLIAAVELRGLGP